MGRRLLLGTIATIGAVICMTRVSAADNVPVLLDLTRTNGATQAQIMWAADGDRLYAAQTTTNLSSGNWLPIGGGPISPTSLVGVAGITSSESSRFFRVYPLDTQGPVISYRYPTIDGIAVRRASALTVRVSDETGVDTTSVALTINGTNHLSQGSPGVLVSTNGFQYTPSTEIWGSYAETASVEFVCADVLGNATTSRWSFTLELEPVITNALVHLQPPSGGKLASLRAASLDAGRRHSVPFSEELSIVSLATNQLVLAYTGASHGLAVGLVLINHDPAHFFYRRITALEDDPPNSQVTVQTVHVQLTEIVQQGSFTPDVLSAVSTSGLALDWEDDFGGTIPFSYESELSLQPIDINEHVRLVPGRFWIDLEGELGVAFTVVDWKMKELDATLNTEISAALRSSVEFRQAVSLLDWSTTIGTPITLATIPIGLIGPVPVWIEVRLGIGWGASLDATGAVTFETGIDAYAKTDVQINWTPEGWTPTEDVIYDVTPVPLDIGFQTSAEAFVYLRPRLDAALCPIPVVIPDGLASIYADYKLGPALEASYEEGDSQCQITLNDKQSVDVGLTVVGIDVADMTLYEHSEPIRTWYWPAIVEQSPVFTRRPRNTAATVGDTITLTASASGSPAPTYQWFQDNESLPFQTQPRLSIQATEDAAGDYYVSAVNRLGRATSETATVAVTQADPQDSVPDDMALIPAGSFSMGDQLEEGSSDESPVHTVTVSAFYMDKYEVTKVLWDKVANWAITHGYDISAAGGSMKAPSHPVFDVTWYECLKWCNARSEMEGRLPAYYTSSAKTTVYRTGEVNVQNDWVSWNSGYRLPTEAEWEKAARGGRSWLRFPWWGRIQHARANYYSRDSYSYDTSATRGYHPDYDDGVHPYTSPVGDFAPNGYGLYDMTGNVWEWCWDSYGSSYYGASSGSDPRGPVSGSYRVARGGSWGDDAYYCRVALRNDIINPDFAVPSGYLGFRVCLPPGQ
jgi:formylglycine-generating enzyme required for sulfatase activity